MQSTGLSSFVAGISGISGSGKTYIIQRLCEKLGTNAVLLSFDDYYRPLHEQEKDSQGQTNFDLPNALYHQKFAQDLSALSTGHALQLKKYNFELENAPEKTEWLNPAPIVFAEGLYVFHLPHIDDLLNMRIMVEADMALTLERRLHRDETERGIPRDRSLYQWHNHVLPSYKEHILPYRNRCDIVLQNNGGVEDNIELLLQSISKKLVEQQK